MGLRVVAVVACGTHVAAIYHVEFRVEIIDLVELRRLVLH